MKSWIITVIVFITLFSICLFSHILFRKVTVNNFIPTKTPFKQTMISSSDHKLLTSIMGRTHDMLTHNKIVYLLMAGSLMGSQRYNNRMPWDDDIDIGIMATDIKEFESLPFSKYGLAITKVFFGYKIYDITNYRRVNLEWHFPFVDVFTIVKDKDMYVFSDKRSRIKWANEAIKSDELFPLSLCSYNGLSLPCPGKTTDYLDRAYPGWSKTAYITGSHTGDLLFRKYIMPVNETTNKEVHDYLNKLSN